MKKKILITAILALLLIIFGYNYVYQDHRNIAAETAEFKMNSEILFNEFNVDPASSETKYLNKTMEISGTVTNTDDLSITLDHKVYCQLISPIDKKLQSSIIVVKGRFIGYDNLLEQIKLDQCSIIYKH